MLLDPIALAQAELAGPEGLIAEARRLYSPIYTVCLFSGGHDSTVVAHRCYEHYDLLAFMDTGTAAPGVIAHVQQTAAWLGKPLRIIPAGDAYERMVLGDKAWWAWYEANRQAGESPDDFQKRTKSLRRRGDGLGEAPQGFPGPGHHAKAFTRLKERGIDKLLKDIKRGQPRSARVLFLSGVRRQESARRAAREPITKHRAKVYCNPLIGWSNEEMRLYRVKNGLPESDMAALTHRSSECNCGSFAKPGEREELMSMLPSWWHDGDGKHKSMAELERVAQERGLKRSVWGQGGGPAVRKGVAPPMCTDCQLRFDIEEPIAAFDPTPHLS